MSLFRIDNKILSTQKCYRAMLWALCTPGSLQKMDFAENDRGLVSGLPMPVALMSRTLLDEQVSVAAFDIDSDSWLDEIIAATGARKAGIDEADYILASSVPRLVELRSVKQGTLLSPEEIEISGPGVEDSATLYVSPAMFSLMKHRTAIQFEYPLGFDLFAIGSDGYLLGLPRTSSVKVVTEKG
ncbi:MAG: phosphonate C-P lyase system protein PhnH [Deltaproteobacteria bacterium]|nr:phosphonate C-P lyase system protein PhnH [Deltaproteobacteria bacterium]